jgi:hypothetical protein
MLSTVVAWPLMGIWLALSAPGDVILEVAEPAKPAAKAPQMTDEPSLPGVDEKPGPGAAEKPPTTADTKAAPAKQPASQPAKAERKNASTPAAKSHAKEPAVVKKAVPRRQLSAEMAALRDRARYSLVAYLRQPLNTRDFTAGEILVGCLPFGCQTEVTHEGQTLNGITCLCWNYPCGGYEMLFKANDHIAARVGYGLQSQPGQMLAVLALSRVPSDYPMRAGAFVKSVADLVEYEKLACRAGSNQSLRLIGLAHYVPKGQTWKNALGETWSVERLVEDELPQPMASAPDGGTLRLLGLSLAITRHGTEEPKPRSPMARAMEFVGEYQSYAFRLQNSDGSWNPKILAATGATNDQIGQLRATGYVLSWLAFSLPQDQLVKPAMIRGVEYLTENLGVEQARWNVAALSKSGFDGVMQALNALAIYDLRVFQPCDPPAEEAKPAAGAD